jgi:hypothetical protein
MAIRFGFGRSAAEKQDPDGDPRAFGVAVLLIGLGFAWVASREGHVDLRAIGLVMAASGGWLAGLYRLVHGVARGRAIVGGLFTGWAVVGALAAAWNGYWVVTLPCAALLLAGLLVLGVVPLPAWGERALAVVRRFGFGLAFMAMGLFVVVASLGGATSEGTPPPVGVVAGAVFVLGGLLFVVHESGGGATVMVRTCNALLITGLAACAVALPPTLLALSLIGTVPLTVLAWIAVARLVIQRRTGRDPLGTWSDQRVLGLGCGLSVALALLALGVLQLSSCLRQPGERPPAEAPALPSGLGPQAAARRAVWAAGCGWAWRSCRHWSSRWYWRRSCASASRCRGRCSAA